MVTGKLKLKSQISTRQHVQYLVYEYSKMTFGLCNAPATFQRWREQVLYDLNNKICAIWSSSLDEYLERLDAVKRLAAAGLKMKPSKFSFFKVGYLGYVISSNAAETNTPKIDAVIC